MKSKELPNWIGKVVPCIAPNAKWESHRYVEIVDGPYTKGGYSYRPTWKLSEDGRGNFVKVIDRTYEGVTANVRYFPLSHLLPTDGKAHEAEQSRLAQIRREAAADAVIVKADRVKRMNKAIAYLNERCGTTFGATTYDAYVTMSVEQAEQIVATLNATFS